MMYMVQDISLSEIAVYRDENKWFSVVYKYEVFSFANKVEEFIFSLGLYWM